MKLSRRTFLIGGGVVALAAAGFAAVRSKREEEVVRLLLQKHLPGIAIPGEATSLYLQDLRELASTRFLRTLKLVSVFWFAYPLLSLPLVRRARDKFEHRMVVDFLLSTNFFRDEAVREGREQVQYTAFYKSNIACSNPFAVLS